MAYVIPPLANISYQKVHFGRNKLQFINPALTGTSAQYEADIKMEGTLIATLQSKEQPGSGIGGTFEYGSIVNNYLAFQKPGFLQKEIVKCEGIIKKFKLETYANRPANPVSMEGYVIKAGLNYRDFSAYKESYFQFYQSLNHQFLTWQPRTKVVSKSQPEFLYFLVNFTPNPYFIRLCVGVNYKDGTSEQLNDVLSAATTNFEVFSVPVGHDALGLGQVKEVKSYQVWLTDGVYRRVSEVRTYVIDTDYRRNESFVLFNNSLGGFDTLRCLGQQSAKVSIQQQLSDTYLFPDYSLPDAQSTVWDTVGRIEKTANTGFLSQDYLKYLQEIFFATELYELSVAGHLPLQLTSKDMVFENKDEYLPSVSLTFAYRFEERFFSDIPVSFLPAWTDTGEVFCMHLEPRSDASVQKRQRDENPYSPTYQQTRVVDAGFDHALCPLEDPTTIEVGYFNEDHGRVGDVETWTADIKATASQAFTGTFRYQVQYQKVTYNEDYSVNVIIDKILTYEIEFAGEIEKVIAAGTVTLINNFNGINLMGYEQWTYSGLAGPTYI